MSSPVTIKAGKVEITAVYDIDFDIDRERIFPDVAETDWQGLDDYLTPEKKVRLVCASYLIRSMGQTILCDTAMRSVAGSEPGLLLQGLKQAGAEPEDIDTVIFTHVHRDHVGWNVAWQDGQPGLVFPNAKYLMHEVEWRHASAPERSASPTFVEQLKPLQDLGALVLIDGERTRLTDEVTAISSFGHTPGHVSLEIESDGDRVFIQGDVVVHHVLLPRPAWTPRFDFEPAGARELRDRELERWSRERLLIAANHFPFPGFGHVEKDGDAWRWQPLSTS